MRALTFLIVAAFLLSACSGSSSSARSSTNTEEHRSSGTARGSIRSNADYGMHIKVRQHRVHSKAEKRARQKPSEIPGLTKGQVEDMPDVPALPSLFGLYDTEAQLEAHAMISAREDVQGGMADLFTVEQRYLYIRFLWLDEWQMRKQMLTGVIDQQGTYALRLREAAARNAAWERINRKRRADHQQEMMRIKREDLPVLTAAEARAINSM
jgi:hypothetical protein